MALEVVDQKGFGVNDHRDSLTLTVVVKEVREEGLAPYFVAQCVELPGCVSDGKTEEEARSSIQNAMRACLGVLFEDSIRRLTGTVPLPDLRGVSSQYGLEVELAPRVHAV